MLKIKGVTWVDAALDKPNMQTAIFAAPTQKYIGFLLVVESQKPKI